jgi:L-alanine-DL-glutamate epimerase-like enolase superfamily enzyme
MRIERYTLTRFQFPRARIMGDSRVRIDTHFIGSVELHGDNGAVGLGFFGTLLHPLPPLVELERVFAAEVAPGLMGKNAFALTNRMVQQAGRTGPAGLFDQAVEHALWDLQGKALGLPLYKLLGGTRNRVRTYVSGLDFHLSLDELRTFYAQAAQRGFTAFKLKFGHPDVRWELARLRTVSEAIGPEAVLMVDANEAWTPKEAVRRAHIYHDEGYSIYWLEDPCARDDVEGLAYVARAVPFTQINVGEYTDLRGRRRLLESGAADILNTWGSITEIIQSIRLADEFKRPVALSNMYLEQGIHAAVAAPEVAWLEYSVQAYDCLVEQPVQYEAGYAIAPERPGNGLALSDFARSACSQPG